MNSKLGATEALGWVAIGAAGVVAAGIAMYLFLGDPEGSIAVGPIDSHRPQVGAIAPDFALVDARDGETVRRLSDFRGKTIVLNWFASWCGPCRSEMPDFEEAYQSLGAEDGEVVFLLVNLQESRTTAIGMLLEMETTYPALLDQEGSVADHYRVVGMPTTFFIDTDGVIYATGRGLVTAEALRGELRALGHSY